MYDYELEKPKIFTDDGIKILLRIRDGIHKHFETSCAIYLLDAINNFSASYGGNWFHLACVDFLLEIGDIVEITREGIPTQSRILLKRF